MEKKRDVGVGAALVDHDDENESLVQDRSREERHAAPAEEKRHEPRPKRRKATNVRKLRLERMMSKAEMARRANLSVLTIDRIEKGYGCRMDTKRKILEALGLSLEDRVKVFGEDD
ncbi:MAG: helix-turn-helix transcriptional regulator [Deltaproteobacteria bacterium]|nr:helix-turn-helix transcriptional regulator [Deltaproteobacteria bacterium]